MQQTTHRDAARQESLCLTQTQTSTFAQTQTYTLMVMHTKAIPTETNAWGGHLSRY